MPNFRWKKNAAKLAGGYSLMRFDPASGVATEPSVSASLRSLLL
jgi:hypothetical protein